jgi:Na+/H+ antiporter NhaD/arsenite permease-like protein
MPAPSAVPLFAALPFAALLLAIALLPLLAPRWWESNLRKLLVAGILGLPVAAYYLTRRPHELLDTAADYLSFIVLLTALYVIAGGVRLHGDLQATPAVNTAFLATGTALASFVGTTGAAMLVIRALLQTNRQRSRVRHTVVFFIFLVCNTGGLLTPLGDPPLFLGYLAGVPFAWTLGLWRPWLFTNGALLALYFAWDRIAASREPSARSRADREMIEPLRIEGALNGVWLLAAMLAVGFLRAPVREIALVFLAGLSLRLTAAHVRRANGFTARPMGEVAALFLGIFITMMPALDLLRANAPALGVREPWQFFWATGLVSSVLDNAPTYLAFLALARGLGLPAEVAGVPEAILAAIALGAVFMGANTYIANAPNFMVKSIAEEAGIDMPSFFGYLAYSATVLIPLFAVLTVIFL